MENPFSLKRKSTGQTSNQFYYYQINYNNSSVCLTIKEKSLLFFFTLKAFVLVRLKFFVYFILRIYFFYFTPSFFQNTSIRLCILKIYFNIIFIFHHGHHKHCHGHHHNHHKAYNTILDMLKQTSNHD